MNHRRAAWIAVLAVVLFFAPMIVRHEVIFPHGNEPEVGLPAPEHPEHLENRRFSDESSFYLPELHHQIASKHASWISLWNPHVEMGRPTSHIGGLSPAYWLTHAFSWIWYDAFELYTALVIATLMLTAAFSVLFLAEIGLSPLAALLGALAIALGPFSIYWLTALMFLSSQCWAMCLLWLVARHVRRPSLAGVVGIAFAMHSMIVSGYPQQIVVFGYLIAGFTLLELTSRVAGWRARLASSAWVAVALAGGVLASAPVLLDLWATAQASARLDPDENFLLGLLPELGSIGDVLRWLGNFFDPHAQGNAMAREYRFTFFTGVSWTPFFGVLALVALAARTGARAWYWLGFAALCVLALAWPALYRFGVRHAFLGFSRFIPFAAASAACMIAAAIGIDRVLGERPQSGAPRWTLAVVVAFVPALLTFVGFRATGSELSAGWFAAECALCLGTAFFIWRPRPWLAIALASAALAHESACMILARPEASIQIDSELVQAIRERTSDGSRFACYGMPIDKRTLPPNQEALLGLSSVHSYDSLSPERWQSWVLRISDMGTHTFGRMFTTLAGETKLASPDFRRSGVSLLISPVLLNSPALESAGSVGALRLYRPRTLTRREAQLTLDGKDLGLAIERLAAPDELMRFRVTPRDTPTLLWISQQYHADWVAHAGDAAAETLAVDGFYQGVIVPPNTAQVWLEFRPWSRWSWVPQISFIILLALAFHRRARVCRHPPVSTGLVPQA